MVLVPVDNRDTLDDEEFDRAYSFVLFNNIISSPLYALRPVAIDPYYTTDSCNFSS